MKDLDEWYMQVCAYCGCYHSGVCPRVKLVEYHPNGTIKKVEFHDQKEEDYQEYELR